MKDKKGHFNYSYKLEDKDNPDSVIKGWWVETNTNDAPFSIWYQMIMGDVSDNVKGLFGKGVAWCNKRFEGLNVNQVRTLVHEEYIKEYGQSKGIYEFQKNYRLLHLLENDEDFMREVQKLPNFPIISEAIHDLQIENEDELKF